MKIVKILFILASILLAFFLGYAILNTYVSLKYEIDEIRWLTDKVHIDIAEEYLKGQIGILQSFLFYVFINVILWIISLFVRNK